MTTVTLERILERLDQQSTSRRPRSQSPKILRNLEVGETFIKTKPTRMEPRGDVGVKGTRSHSPWPLRITSVESNSVKSVESSRVKESERVPQADVVTWSAVPTRVTTEIEKIPESRPVCTSTKRDKIDSVLETKELTESASPGVLGTEVTQDHS